MKIPLDELEESLNEWGCLSTTFIMSKYNLSEQEACDQLQRMADQYQNVRFKTETLIYIYGREPKWWNIGRSKRKIKVKKKSKWKDITKP